MNEIRLLSFIKNGDLEKAKTLVPLFYIFLFFFAFLRLTSMRELVSNGSAIFSPRWPLFWANSIGFSSTIYIVMLGFVGAVLLASFLYANRIVRIFAFIATLFFHALQNSFEGRDQHLDLWLWVSFLFIFLPDIWKKQKASHDEKLNFLTVFWAAQAIVLLAYSMSGMWKLLDGIQQLIAGQVSIFSPDAAALQIATSMLRLPMDSPSLLGPFLIQHSYVAFLPLMALLYLQFFALWAAFKPNLHLMWAFCLALFHVSVYLTLDVMFLELAPLVLLLFASSPFKPAQVSIKDILLDLPIIGLVYAQTQKMWAD